MSRPQTLAQAITLAHDPRNRNLHLAATALAGCPEGGWPETVQAREQVLAALPAAPYRTYTTSEFVAAAYTIDHTGRYRSALGQGGR